MSSRSTTVPHIPQSMIGVLVRHHIHNGPHMALMGHGAMASLPAGGSLAPMPAGGSYLPAGGAVPTNCLHFKHRM